MGDVCNNVNNEKINKSEPEKKEQNPEHLGRNQIVGRLS